MNVKTIHMSDLFNKCDDLYKVVMIVAKRAKQIIEDRFVPIDETEEVEDSIKFEEPIVITYTDKPETNALEDYLNGNLEWRFPSENDQPVDAS